MTSDDEDVAVPEDHRHHYYRYHPRGFGNEYAVIAVPEGHRPARKRPVQGKDGLDEWRIEPLRTSPDATLRRIKRDDAIRAARRTGDDHTTYDVTVTLCPHCDGDALQQTAKRMGNAVDYRPGSALWRRVEHAKRITSGYAEPTSVPREEVQ